MKNLVQLMRTGHELSVLMRTLPVSRSIVSVSSSLFSWLPKGIEGSEIAGKRIVAADARALGHSGVVVASDSGEVVVFSEQLPEGDVVGEVGVGILHVACSPDAELCVIVTSELVVIVMSSDFDVVAETKIPRANANASTTATSSGNTAPQQQQQQQQQQGSSGQFASAADPSKPFAHIVWRPDSSCFSIMSRPANGLCEITTWTRSGQFEARNEPLKGNMIPGVMDWRPVGNLLAVGERTTVGGAGTTDRVVFFERNGLQHYDFSFQEKCELQALDWNRSADLLACTILRPSGRRSVLLYHRTNYTWTCKYDIPLNPAPNSGTTTAAAEKAAFLQVFHWDHFSADVAMNAYLVSPAGYEYLHFQWDDSTVSNPDISPSVAAVVDGNSVKLTPLAIANIPPPMSACVWKPAAAALPLCGPVIHFGFCNTPAAAPAPAIQDSTSSIANASANASATAPATIGSAQGFAVHATGLVSFLTNYAPRGPREMSKAPETLAIVDFGRALGREPVAETTTTPGICITHPVWIAQDLFAFVLAGEPVATHHRNAGSNAEIKLAASAPYAKDWKDTLYLFKLAFSSTGAQPTLLAEMTLPMPPDKTIFRTTYDLASRTLFVQSGFGTLFSVDPHSEGPLELSEFHNSFPLACNWFAPMHAGKWIVGLSANGSLQIMSHPVESNVASFVVRGEYVVFVTRNSIIRFVRIPASTNLTSELHKVVHAAISIPAPAAPQQQQQQQQQQGRNRNRQPQNQHRAAQQSSETLVASANTAASTAAGMQLPTQVAVNPDDPTSRVVEQGARIVTVIPRDAKVVLQMPRGNLETITPRILELDKIGHFLDQREYARALVEMRKHRVDMNMLYDHNPAMFLRDVPLLLSQVTDNEHLNLFLSALTASTGPAADDREGIAALRSKIGSPLPEHLVPFLQDDGQQRWPGKVNAICDLLRQELLRRKEDRDLLTVLTTYVKSDPPRLEEMLECVKAAAGRTEEAIGYATFLTDVQHLYRVALGMYDLKLTLTVAQASSMDPKEYLSFLGEFEAIPSEALRRYAIDVHLGRWERALADLIDAGFDAHGARLDQCIALIKRHSLYNHATILFRADAERRGSHEQLRVVYRIYAEYLVELGKLREAGMLYRLAGENALARDYFMRATAWEEALLMAKQTGMTLEQIADLAADLADALKTSGRYDEAARALEPYDPAAAFALAIEGQLWRQAMRLSTAVADGLVQLDTAVLAGYQQKLAQLKGDLQEFKTRLARLRVVREIKRQQAASGGVFGGGGGGGGDEDGFDFPDNASSVAFSDASASSARSGRTTTSRASSKNRKKMQRNWFKEGSPYEEVYLLDTLNKLVPLRISHEQVAHLVSVLDFLGRFEQSRELETQYDRFAKEIAALMHEVWPEPEDSPAHPSKVLPTGIPVPHRPDIRTATTVTWERTPFSAFWKSSSSAAASAAGGGGSSSGAE